MTSLLSPSAAHRSALSVAGLSVVILTRALGQELPPPIMARASDISEEVETGPALPSNVPAPPTAESDGHMDIGDLIRTGPFSFHLFAVASAVFNDNIYIQPSNRQSDLIWTLTPGFELGTGDYVEKQESWLTIEYAPSFILFTRHTTNDSIDQHATLQTEWRPADWIFHLQQEYQRLSGPVVEAGGRVNRSIYDTNLDAEYVYSPKTSFELAANQSINDYGPPLFGFNTWQLSTSFDYWLTPKIRLKLGSVGGIVHVTANPGQQFERELLTAQYDMTEEIWFSGSSGVEWRQFEGNSKSRVNGIFSLAAHYQFERDTALELDAYRRDESSLTTAAQNYTITGLGVALSEAVGDRFHLRLGGGYDHSDYYSTAEERSTSARYDYFYLRPGIDFELVPQATLGVFYEYARNRSALANGFENNQAGFDLNYHF